MYLDISNKLYILIYYIFISSVCILFSYSHLFLLVHVVHVNMLLVNVLFSIVRINITATDYPNK